MNFQTRKGLGILLMAVFLVFIIATASTLFLHKDEGNHSEAPPAEGGHSWTTENEGSEEKRITPEPRRWSAWPEGFEPGGTSFEVPYKYTQ